jgi:hypothetical protein
MMLYVLGREESGLDIDRVPKRREGVPKRREVSKLEIDWVPKGLLHLRYYVKDGLR